MKKYFTFKNGILILWALSLVLFFFLFQYKYYPTGPYNDSFIKIDRITGEYTTVLPL